jgi:ElaB/YqjD/DUF883 family membrane-anchored ribosome-binding protein
MARASTASDSTEELTTQDLRDQIGKLSDDISKLTEIVAGLGEQSARHARDDIRARGAAAAQRGQEEFEHLRQAAHHAQGDIDDMITQRPMMSVGLALGLGFLFGLMTGRK